MSWAKKIRELRESRGLSQARFAELGQCSVGTVRAIENEKRQASIPTLDLLLRGVGSSLPEFFESKIPESYANSTHQRLHEMLQKMLELGDGYTEKAQFAIECVYSKLTEESRTRSGPKRARRAATG